MKKNIIIAAIAAASALLLSVSCQKENQPESQNGINGGAKTFTATIEQGLTKTTITNDYKVNWKTSDEININGVTFKATPDGTDATKATFAKDPDTQGDPTGETFKAIYPSTLYVTDHFELPTTQTYTAGEFNAPMYAESTTQTLSFKNICAVLAIKVTSADINALKSIKVKSDKKLNGTFTVASTTDVYKAVIGTDGTDEVVLSVGETPIDPTTDGITFYIAIPAQEYSYLKIYLSEDGTLYKRAMITKKAAGLGTIDCNKIYNINYETNAVQMYADGPYWSTMNIGARAATDCGTYFSWGSVENVYSLSGTTFTFQTDNPNTTRYIGTWTPGNGFAICNAPYYNGSEYTKYQLKGTEGEIDTISTLKDDDDAATANWGAAWKMPAGGASGQFTALINNTENEWTTIGGVDGRKLSGKTTYSDISVFFPVTGSGDALVIKNNQYGIYWSSTLKQDVTGNKTALVLYLGSSVIQSTDIGGQSRYIGLPVRPISE